MNCIHVEFEVPGNNFLSAGSASDSVIRKYHLSRGDSKRNKIIVPDSAHGTNPASAAMCGFEIINVKSDKRGNVDLKALKEAVNK